MKADSTVWARLAAAIVIAATPFISTTAQAATASTSAASIDWGTLVIQVFDVNPTDNIAPELVWGTDNASTTSNLFSEYVDGNGTQLESDIDGFDALGRPGFSIDAITTYTQSSAAQDAGGSAPSGTMAGAASSTQPPFAAGYQQVNSTYSLINANTFTVTGDAFVLVSVNASVSATATGGFTNDFFDNAFAGSTAGLSIQISNDRGNQVDGLFVQAISSGIFSDRENESVSRVLQVGLFFRTGEVGGLVGSLQGGAGNNVNSPAPVPVPAAAWLLGSALLGMAGFGRRRSA